MPLFQVNVYLLENGKVRKLKVKINARNRDEAERLILLLFGSVVKIK